MPEALTSDRFNEWTACETNGHQYEECECDNCWRGVPIWRCVYCLRVDER